MPWNRWGCRWVSRVSCSKHRLVEGTFRSRSLLWYRPASSRGCPKVVRGCLSPEFCGVTGTDRLIAAGIKLVRTSNNTLDRFLAGCANNFDDKGSHDVVKDVCIRVAIQIDFDESQRTYALSARQPHTIADPPPCIMVGVWHLGSYLLSTGRFASFILSIPNKLNLLSSNHSTQSQFSWVQCSCSCANLIHAALFNELMKVSYTGDVRQVYTAADNGRKCNWIEQDTRQRLRAARCRWQFSVGLPVQPELGSDPRIMKLFGVCQWVSIIWDCHNAQTAEELTPGWILADSWCKIPKSLINSFMDSKPSTLRNGLSHLRDRWSQRCDKLSHPCDKSQYYILFKLCLYSLQ